MQDRYFEGRAQRQIKDLHPGDRVDLENDEFADPQGSSSDHMSYECEFAVVEAIEHETPECTRVDFESAVSVGFPPDHWVDVDGEQVRDT